MGNLRRWSSNLLFSRLSREEHYVNPLACFPTLQTADFLVIHNIIAFIGSLMKVIVFPKHQYTSTFPFRFNCR